MSNLTPSWDDINQDCIRIADNIIKKGFGIDYIVGLSRGGSIPGVMLSHLLGIPLITVMYSSKAGAGDDKNHANDLPIISKPHEQFANKSPIPAALLIVDDICDSGNTLYEVVDHYMSIGNSVISTTLYYKQLNNSIFVPDIFSHSIPFDSPWVVFPWEIQPMLNN